MMRPGCLDFKIKLYTRKSHQAVHFYFNTEPAATETKDLQRDIGDNTIYLRQILEHHGFAGTSAGFEYQEDLRRTSHQTASPASIINTRWVCQGRLPSLRLLHFSPQELIWECAGTTACECCMMQSHDPGIVSKPKVDFAQQQIKGDCVDSGGRLLFHRLVEEYTNLSIAFQRDKLAAFAGIAKNRKQLCHEHVIGTWQDFGRTL
jgi:hypothetical protein